jgi:hypothetical protein
VSGWGYGLLAVFVVLGLSPVGVKKAMRIAGLVTLAGLIYAFHSYGAL